MKIMIINVNLPFIEKVSKETFYWKLRFAEDCQLISLTQLQFHDMYSIYDEYWFFFYIYIYIQKRFRKSFSYKRLYDIDMLISFVFIFESIKIILAQFGYKNCAIILWKCVQKAQNNVFLDERKTQSCR